VLDSRIQAGSAQLGIGAVFARISEVWIANSDITGVAIPVIFGHYIETTSALDLARSRLRLWRSRLRGGDGAPALKASNDGGAGIRASHSLVELFGGPSTIVAGGAGAGPQAGGPSHGGPGMDLRESSHVRAQAGVLVQGGSEPGGPSAPAIRNDGTSSFTLDPKIFPTLVSSAQQVTLGSTFALTLTGNPGGYQVLFASLRTGPTTIYRRVVGFGLLDRPNMMRIATEVLPPSAAFTLTLRVPSMPALIGATFFLQAAEQVGNAYAIGNPALVTITG
jgi:hypothetical protein